MNTSFYDIMNHFYFASSMNEIRYFFGLFTRIISNNNKEERKKKYFQKSIEQKIKFFYVMGIVDPYIVLGYGGKKIWFRQQ